MMLTEADIDLLERFRVRGRHTPDEINGPTSATTSLGLQSHLFKRLRALTDEGYLLALMGQWSLTVRGEQALQAWKASATPPTSLR